MINWHTPWSSMWLSLSHRPLRETLRDNQEFPLSAALSAREAWERVRPRLREFDQQASLRSIEAPLGVHPDGKADAWLFGVDAPNRRAQGQMEWINKASEGISCIQRCMHPFPAIGSPQHLLAATGVMPDRWLDACWTSMRERAADIPEDFLDSPHVMSFLASRGVPVDCGDRISLLAPEAGPDPAEWTLELGQHKFRLPTRPSDLPH